MPPEASVLRSPTIPTYNNNLAAVCCYFNPCRYRSRLANYRRFAQGIERAGVRLLTVELAFGIDPFELDGVPNVIQLRSDSVLWQKECLLNVGIRRLLDQGCRNVAWLDADVVFHDPRWPAKVLDALEENAVCQAFAERILHRSRTPQRRKGSVRAVVESGNLFTPPDSPGGAWAARAEILEQVQLYDACIVGGGDAAFFYGCFCCDRFSEWNDVVASAVFCRRMSGPFRRRWLSWSRQCGGVVRGRAGYADVLCEFLPHGRGVDRRYSDRHRLLSTFDPDRELFRNPNGCWEWSAPTSTLAEKVRRYFLDRKEDEHYWRPVGAVAR